MQQLKSTEQLIDWAHADPTGLRLKYLAALMLHEAGWTNERIGQVLGHPRGHVARILRRVRQMVRAAFAPPSECTPGESIERVTKST